METPNDGEKNEGVVEKKEESLAAEPVKKDFFAKLNKKFLLLGILVVAILGVFYYYKGIFIAATVNGSPISRLSVVQDLEKRAGKATLDALITKKLIESEMQKRGVIVKDEDVEAEMKRIEEQVAAQGGTLEMALEGQGMTLEDLRNQIKVRKQLEQVLADKIKVSDEEINQYLSADESTLPKNANSEELRNQAREQLQGQKLNKEADQWLSDLRDKAVIEYYTNYPEQGI